MFGPRRDADKLKVFISYSRDDIEFSDQLDAALSGTGYNAILDRHDIAGADEWKRRLGELIRDADTIVFVLSPSSAASRTCAWEVDVASQLGKRIVPILCKETGNTKAPQQLADLNYIHFYNEPKVPGSGFGSGLAKLIAVLNVDPAWLREHTRLLGLATQWASADRPINRLLSGNDITAAKTWLNERRLSKTEPTELHIEYIKASEDRQSQQDNEQLRQIEEREALVRQSEQDRASRDEAQSRATDLAKREAAQARRVAHRTAIGLIGALVFAAATGIAMLFARDQANLNKAAQLVAEASKDQAVAEAAKARAAEKEVRAAHTRLSAKMKLNIAPLGTERIEISESWYRLATTNAASIAIITSSEDDGSSLGTGFIIRGMDLNDAWGNELVIVTTDSVTSNETDKNGKVNLYVRFPGTDQSLKIKAKTILWRSNDSNKTSRKEFETSYVDFAVLKLTTPPPEGAVPIRIPAAINLESWPRIIDPEQRPSEKINKTLLSIGWYANEIYDNNAQPFLGLTFAINRAVGRMDRADKPFRIFYSDASGFGGAGTPIFDADTGELLALDQTMAEMGNPPIASGVLITTLREAIQRSLAGLPILPPLPDSSPANPNVPPVTETIGEAPR